MNPFSNYNPNARRVASRKANSGSSFLEKELIEESGGMEFEMAAVGGILDEIYDPASGDRWLPLFAGTTTPYGEGSHLLTTEQGLAIVRMMCRYLAVENEFAINAIENRINFIVGSGMNLKIQVKAVGVDPELPEVKTRMQEVQQVLDDELDRINFASMQEEIVRRGDRDGEIFIRVFRGYGACEYRFIEPRDVKSQGASNNIAPFGIQCDPDDITKVISYWVNGEEIPADQIYHLKLNVDSNVRRGIPTLWPIRKNLHRAGKLMKGISSQAIFQASIAAIREHEVGDAGTIQRFADARTSYSFKDPVNSAQKRVQKIDPGRVIDTSSKIKWTFPSVGMGTEHLIAALQQELRAAASRLVFPEHMFTSDASNANMASTIVADGPSYRMFKRMQRLFSRYFADMMDDIIEAKMEAGVLPADTLELFRIVPQAPELASRDPLQTAQANAILKTNGVKSAKTWAGELGLKYEDEQRNNNEAAEANATNMQPVDKNA